MPHVRCRRAFHGDADREWQQRQDEREQNQIQRGMDGGGNPALECKNSQNEKTQQNACDACDASSPQPIR